MQAELAVSSLTVAVTIASTHYAYLWRDGQAELAWLAWLDTNTVYLRTVTHLNTNPARHRVTSLIRPAMLPLSQTATTTSHLVCCGHLVKTTITASACYFNWKLVLKLEIVIL